MTSPTVVTAFAPGGVGNVGPGLDILGLAVAGLGDQVRAEWTGQPGVTILDPGHPDLPADSRRHTAGLAAHAVIATAGRGSHATAASRSRSARACRYAAVRVEARPPPWRGPWR